MKILVTGGLGFIGSHTIVELLEHDYEVVCIDNCYNSSVDVCDSIQKITGKAFTFYQADVCDEDRLNQIFSEEKPEAVIHFAAYKAVGESVEKPLMYYQNNLLSTITLCKVMQKNDCNRFIFSSSATVYGSPKSLPIREDFPLSTTNPYGSTKLMNEDLYSNKTYSQN